MIKWPLLFLFCILLSSCVVVDTAMKTIDLTGQAIGSTFDAGKSAVEFTAKTAGYTARATQATIRMFKKKKAIPLERRGNSYYIKTEFNGKVTGKLLLDTGASSVQISQRIAKKLKLNLKRANKVLVTLANGSRAYAYKIDVDSISVGGLTVKDTPVLILSQEFDSEDDGLLGMSYLKNFHFEIDSQNNLLIMKGYR